MSGPAAGAVLAGVLVDAGLKATVLVGLGALGVRALRRGSAAQRHAVWAATLAGLPVLFAVAVARGPALALDAAGLVPVWAVGVVVVLGPLVVSLARLAALTARATVDADAPWLRWSGEVPGPLTWGACWPVVLLPERARAWPPLHRAAALAHERAHLERGDYLVHLLGWVVCALFWFHPLVWLVRRDLEREAEHAADDRALAAGVLPSDYASLLLSLASRPAPRGALGASSSVIGSRVRAVLDHRSRSPRRGPVAALSLALACGSPFLGAAAPAGPLASAAPAPPACNPETQP